MIFNDFKSWTRFYADIQKEQGTLEERHWIGKYLLWNLLMARRIVADCREKGLPLPQIEIPVGGKKDDG